MTHEEIGILREYIDAKVAYEIEQAMTLHETAHHEQDNYGLNEARQRMERAVAALVRYCESPSVQLQSVLSGLCI